MAAPPISPIPPGLTGTGLAVEKLTLVVTGGAIGNHTASHPGIPVPPEPSDMRRHGTTHTTVFLDIDDGHRRELVDVAGAVRHGVRPVGGVARSVANAMVVQRALDSAARAADLALDPVPLRRSRGSTGLPGQRISSSASFVA